MPTYDLDLTPTIDVETDEEMQARLSGQLHRLDLGNGRVLYFRKAAASSSRDEPVGEWDGRNLDHVLRELDEWSYLAVAELYDRLHAEGSSNLLIILHPDRSVTLAAIDLGVTYTVAGSTPRRGIVFFLRGGR